MAITGFKFGGMNNVEDPVNLGAPADPRDKYYAQCVDIVNFDVLNEGAISRREGSTLLAESNITSAWSNGTDTFCVIGGALYGYVDGVLVAIGNSPTLGASVEFLQVNDIVMFSDNLTIGYLKDSIPYILSSPAEAVDILDLETWVKLTYPAGADADESNMEIDAFKLATFAGRCLEFFNGAVYLAVDNFIYCTRTFNIASMDIRYNVVAGFKDTVTMIKGVDDGLFVGTTGGVYFLAGDGVKGSGDRVQGFKQKKLLPYGVIYGSAVSFLATKSPKLKADNEAVAWLTSDGIYLGAEGGRCESLTANQMYMPAGTTAAAMIRQIGAAWQYLVSIGGGGVGVVVNLKSGAHSRYTNYDFDAFFELGGQCYGTNADGLILLEGETDYDDSPIDAYVLTPVVDFGAPQSKRCPDAYLHTRTPGGLTISLYADETVKAEEMPFFGPHQIDTGARRLRAKLPRGVKATNWQFKIANVDGCRATLFVLDAAPITLKRSY